MPRIPGRRPEFYADLREGLKAFAEATFRLDTRDKEGVTERQHLEGLVARARTHERRREIEASLAVPEMPPELTYLWTAFRRLSGRRGSSGFGPLPIGWPDIDAFQRLTRAALAPWEIEIIEMLDHLFLKTMANPNPESDPSE